MEGNEIGPKRVELQDCLYIHFLVLWIFSQSLAIFADKENLNTFSVCFALSCDN